MQINEETNKEKIEMLINFIQEYGVQFLESDNIKEKILEQLKNGDVELAKEITNAMNEEWFNRVKEIKKFYMFTDRQARAYDQNGKRVEMPFYIANYISHREERDVPTLRHVKQKLIGNYSYSEYDDYER